MEGFLKTYQKLISCHIDGVRELLTNDTIRQVGWEYSQSDTNPAGNSLNVFTMASDLYYRENFHSDIIKAFLDPNEKHGEGTIFLFSFIDFLNDNFRDKVNIAKINFNNAIVEREVGRIDILVRSEDSMHCIIIENKINNAGDMQRQLPRYYDYMTNLGYTIDAIVYLPLDINKHPDMTSWTEDDRKHVLPVLCHVPAFQKKGISLVNGWLLPCTQLTNNIDCISILRQYSNLINLLSKSIMDNVILGKFYSYLLDGDNLQSAISIKNMLNDIPAYMTSRIMDQLKASGFDNVWSWKPRHCGLRFHKNGNEYKVDVWSDENFCYSIEVFVQSIPIADVPWSDEIKKTIADIGFIANDERYRKNYTFIEEAKVLQDAMLLAHQMESMLK